MSTQAMSTALRERLRQWMLRRHGAPRSPAVLQRRNIYLLPTRQGLVFALLLLVMLLGAMNYGSSTGYALTFLLAGMGLVAMHHGHRNLLGLVIQPLGAEPVFAGEPAEFRFRLEDRGRIGRHEIELEIDGCPSGAFDLAARDGGVVIGVAVPTTRRGRHSVGAFRVSSRFPGHLVRVWSWCALAQEVIVYPRPAVTASADPAPAEPSRDDDQATGRGDEDFDGLRGYQRGDTPHHIDWKAYARERGLVVKAFTGGRDDPDWLVLDGGAEPEAELSRLTRRALECSRAGRPFGLRLGTHEIAPGTGARHLHAILEALACHGLDERSRDAH